MNYGYFSPDDHEFVIVRPDTPRPWVNYLSNDVYNAVVSQTGGGFSYYKDCKVNRVLDWDHLHTDRPGRYVYIRDNQAERFWTINWQPVLHGYQGYECRHGLGYTTIRSKSRGIFGEITYFVPEDSACEIWIVKVRNDRPSAADLSLFGFAKLLMGDCFMEKELPSVMALYNRAGFDKRTNAIIAGKVPNTSREIETCAYFGANFRPDGFDTVKEEFYGRYGLVCSPHAVAEGQCSNSENCGEDAVAALQHDMVLKPSEEREFRFILGFAEDMDDIGGTIRKYNNVPACTAALEMVKFDWRERIDGSSIQTPDHDINRFTNVWGKYQLLNTSRWSAASHYRAGEGYCGYREIAQDIGPLLTVDVELARENLRKLLYYQYEDGHAVAGFSALGGPCENPDQGNVPGKSDMAIWLPYQVIAYLKETGDIGFLGEETDFFDGGTRAPVIDHVLRAIDYTYKHRGERGLPLIGQADWNDAFDACGVKGKGESVWLGMALARALKEGLELAVFLGRQDLANDLAAKYNEMKTIINEVAWDGQWYRRLFTDDGEAIGSSDSDPAQIFLNAQTWAVLSGVADGERSEAILAEVEKRLSSDYGPVLFAPAYTEYDPKIGRISAFAPGSKENASVFSHAAAFKVVADCMCGRADAAYSTLKSILPTHPARSERPDLYKAEPYVYAAYCNGPSHPTKPGEGAFTWQTGAAPWGFSAVTEWILGVRRDFTGLHIDPCIPPSWKQCSMRRLFRGATYEITIRNPNGVATGVESVRVDGEETRGPVIPPARDHTVHQVEVIMGEEVL